MRENEINIVGETESFICNSLGISLETLDRITERLNPKPIIKQEESNESLPFGFNILLEILSENKRTKENIKLLKNIYSTYLDAMKSTEYKLAEAFMIPRIKLNNYTGMFSHYNKQYTIDILPKHIKLLKQNNPKMFNDYSVKSYINEETKDKSYILVTKSSKVKVNPNETVYGCWYIYLQGRKEAKNVITDGAYYDKETGATYNLKMQLFTIFRAAANDPNIFDAKFEYPLASKVWKVK